MTPFGTTGPRAAWASTDLVQYAMALWMHATGRPERAPLAVGARLAETIPGLCAASATLMALRARRRDRARARSSTWPSRRRCCCASRTSTSASAYTGVERGRNGMPFPMTIVPAADGYLGVNVLTQTQWELLCAYTGRVDLLDDPRWPRPPTGPRTPRLDGDVRRVGGRQGAGPGVPGGQEWRIPFGYVPHVDEVRDMAQHDARSFFGPVARPGVGDELHVPALPFLVDGERGPVGPRRRSATPGPSPVPPRSPDPRRRTPACRRRSADRDHASSTCRCSGRGR